MIAAMLASILSPPAVAAPGEGLTPALQRGSWSHSVPLDLPPAPAGMVPGLALVSDFRLPDGLLGPGWALSGLSRVDRAGEQLGVPSFDSSLIWRADGGGVRSDLLGELWDDPLMASTSWNTEILLQSVIVEVDGDGLLDLSSRTCRSMPIDRRKEANDQHHVHDATARRGVFPGRGRDPIRACVHDEGRARNDRELRSILRVGASLRLGRATMRRRCPRASRRKILL
ncbi:MAG: hypothetical protein FJ102_17465 [Deltaproteobacteria bacterium]|nr:hypothetical protein [Deltaproteobacteria bacterium]